MYCPTCGTQSPEQTRFCRACGANLHVVSEALSGKLPDPREVEIEQAYQKSLFRGAIFVLVLVLTILTIVKFAVGVIDQDAFGPFVLILSWIAAALLFFKIMVARYRRKVRRQLLEKEVASLAQAKETSRLSESIPAPPLNITEQTTARLSQEAAPERGEKVRE